MSVIRDTRMQTDVIRVQIFGTRVPFPARRFLFPVSRLTRSIASDFPPLPCLYPEFSSLPPGFTDNSPGDQPTYVSPSTRRGNYHRCRRVRFYPGLLRGGRCHR